MTDKSEGGDGRNMREGGKQSWGRPQGRNWEGGKKEGRKQSWREGRNMDGEGGKKYRRERESNHGRRKDVMERESDGRGKRRKRIKHSFPP